MSRLVIQQFVARDIEMEGSGIGGTLVSSGRSGTRLRSCLFLARHGNRSRGGLRNPSERCSWDRILLEEQRDHALDRYGEGVHITHGGAPTHFMSFKNGVIPSVFPPERKPVRDVLPCKTLFTRGYHEALWLAMGKKTGFPIPRFRTIRLHGLHRVSPVSEMVALHRCTKMADAFGSRRY